MAFCSSVGSWVIQRNEPVIKTCLVIYYRYDFVDKFSAIVRLDDFGEAKFADDLDKLTGDFFHGFVLERADNHKTCGDVCNDEDVLIAHEVCLQGASKVDAKRMRALTRVAKEEYSAEGERGTRAWLWHNFLTNGRCVVGQQRSLVITNPRKERLMNAIHCGILPIGKKWGAIQQSEKDSMCPACDAEEETADHFLLRCPNLWEDRFSVDNGNEEQVRKLIIEDCTTKLLSSGKKCNRAQEMEQCKQSCKRVWRLWAARASWKYGSSSAFYQSLEVL
ncbi:hypothetical protein QOT17_009788 [Balamuthia mandrillaris]